MKGRFVCHRHATRAMSRWTAFSADLIIMHKEMEGSGDYLGRNKPPRVFILILKTTSQDKRERMVSGADKS